MRVHHVIGGGAVFHVRPHLAISAPAYGTTARQINELLRTALNIPGAEAKAREYGYWPDIDDVQLHLTKMAGGKDLETNADVGKCLDAIVADPKTGIVFLSAALCDWDAGVYRDYVNPPAIGPVGKDQPRLHSRDGHIFLKLTMAEKLISRVRKTRKDVFLVGFKTTSVDSPDSQYIHGLDMLKASSCNLVFANDVHTRLNMVITPEQARYHETTDREAALKGLVEMALLRSKLHFTRSTISHEKDLISWHSDQVPHTLYTVVNHCIARGAYKPFRGSTVGHFAVKVDEQSFLTSIRKTDFNKLSETGLVRVEASDDESVVAFGAKPSVGGQSQRIIFKEHPDADCIVHFHCPKKPGSEVPSRSQREFECGSHECGKNTSDGLKKFGKVRAVMLDQHGPNIVFHRDTDPQEVIAFIEANFDLQGRTDDVRS